MDYETAMEATVTKQEAQHEIKAHGLLWSDFIAEPWTLSDAKRTYNFLNSENPDAPSTWFQQDRFLFARRCNTSANRILTSGFAEIAITVLDIRDRADPEFITKVRHDPNLVVIGRFALPVETRLCDVPRDLNIFHKG